MGTLELSGPPGRGLSDALRQYGDLRSVSITQQAAIRMEERKLEHWQKRLAEEGQKARLLDDRLQALKALIDEKSESTMHLTRDIGSGSHMAVYLEMRSMSADCGEDSPYGDAPERDIKTRRMVDRTHSTMNKMQAAKESKGRRALHDLLACDGSKLKRYLDASASLVQMIKEVQVSSEDGSPGSHKLHEALAVHVSAEPSLAAEVDEELAALSSSLQMAPRVRSPASSVGVRPDADGAPSGAASPTPMEL